MSSLIAVLTYINLLKYIVKILLIDIKSYCDNLYMLGPGIGTIRSCGIVKVGMSLWLWALRPSS